MKKLYSRLALCLLLLTGFTHTYSTDTFSEGIHTDATDDKAINNEIKSFIKKTAKQKKLSVSKVEEILSQAEFIPTIVKKTKRMAESTFSWEKYKNRFLSEKRIQNGIEYYNQNKELLDDIYKKYGVSPEVVVAIFGVETSYGSHTGSHSSLDVLYTLSFYQKRRKKFYKRELSTLISMLASKELLAEDAKGSFAGAIGYPQFMPTSVEAYAVDYDQDGRVELFEDGDALASIAHYLYKHRWQKDAPVMVEAKKTKKFKSKYLSRRLKPKVKISTWGKRGLKPTTKVNLSSTAKAAGLQYKEDDKKSYWLAFKNFYAITRYNQSRYYARVVHMLSQEIKRGASPAQ